MSTNYYLRRTCETPCPHCDVEDLHLGQTAGGWQFMFQGDRESGVVDYASWVKQLDGSVVITNEYGDDVTVADMIQIVEQARGGRPRGLHTADHWTDSDGNTFSSGYFS